MQHDGHEGAKSEESGLRARINTLSNRHHEEEESDLSCKHERMLNAVDGVDHLIDALHNLLNRISPVPTDTVRADKKAHPHVSLAEMLNSTPYALNEKVGVCHDIVNRIHAELFDIQ